MYGDFTKSPESFSKLSKLSKCVNPQVNVEASNARVRAAGQKNQVRVVPRNRMQTYNPETSIASLFFPTPGLRTKRGEGSIRVRTRDEINDGLRAEASGSEVETEEDDEASERTPRNLGTEVTTDTSVSRRDESREEHDNKVSMSRNLVKIEELIKNLESRIEEIDKITVIRSEPEEVSQDWLESLSDGSGARRSSGSQKTEQPPGSNPQETKTPSILSNNDSPCSSDFKNSSCNCSHTGKDTSSVFLKDRNNKNVNFNPVFNCPSSSSQVNNSAEGGVSVKSVSMNSTHNQQIRGHQCRNNKVNRSEKMQ